MQSSNVSRTALFLVAATCCFHSEQAGADPSAYYPAAIVCSVAGKQNYVYLSAVESDGSVRYMTLVGAYVTFRPDGVAERPNQQGAGDCAGKTIEELRAAGQTREFAPPGG